MDWNFIAKSVIAMLVITAPPDPAKLIFFNAAIARENIHRSAGALRVAFVVAFVLGIGALGGAQIAEALGIDLNAFSIVGGIVVAGMGFEMLYGGGQSKAQGQDAAKQGPDEDSGLIMPLAIPLIAGPGAIVTAVSISTSNPEHGMVGALSGVAAVAGATFISFVWLGGLLAKVPANATALLMRLGGLLLATIGTQMLLGGLKQFFAN